MNSVRDMEMICYQHKDDSTLIKSFRLSERFPHRSCHHLARQSMQAEKHALHTVEGRGVSGVGFRRIVSRRCSGELCFDSITPLIQRMCCKDCTAQRLYPHTASLAISPCCDTRPVSAELPGSSNNQCSPTASQQAIRYSRNTAYGLR
jgi:hypothetical protein